MDRRVWVVLFVAYLGAIAWTGCAFVSRTPCASNDECRSGLLCVDDICVAPEAYKPYQLAGALGTQACEEPAPQGPAGIRTIRFALKRDHAQLQPILGRNGLQLTTKQLSIDDPIRITDQDGNDVSKSVSVSITMAQDFATISMFGFFETKLNYTITGGTKGHTYWISAPLNITHPLLAPPKKTTQGNIVFSIRY